MSARYAVKRIAYAVLTIFLILVVIFVLLRLTPGSAVEELVRNDETTYGMSAQQAYNMVSRTYDLQPNEPILTALLHYLGQVLQGNLGRPMASPSVTVDQIIAQTLPWTAFVATVSLFFSFSFGIFLGAQMAWKRKSFLEPIISVYSIITTSIPDFIIGIILLVIFAYTLNWFPYSGAYGISVTPGFNWPFFASVLRHAALPIFTFIITHLGAWALSMRASAVGVIGEDYTVAARARGVLPARIRSRYVMRNALLPMVTSLAITFGYMLSGSVLVENTFQYPGIGFFMGQATSLRDYTEMEGLLLVISIAVVLANLIADLLYAKLDPRIKLEE